MVTLAWQECPNLGGKHVRYLLLPRLCYPVKIEHFSHFKGEFYFKVKAICEEIERNCFVHQEGRGLKILYTLYMLLEQMFGVAVSCCSDG